MNGTKEVSGILSPFVGSEGTVAFGYRTLGRWSPDFYPLALLAKYFQRLLLERLRFKEALAYTPGVHYHAEDDFGMFAIAAGASLNEMDRAETLLEGGVHWLKKGHISVEQLQVLKDAMILELAINYESNASLADYYVSSLSQLRTDGQLAHHQASIEHIIPGDLHRVANKYLKDDSRVIVRETPTLTFTQFFAGLGVLIVGVAGAGFYMLRRFIRRRYVR
jgi:predicted Zn-dependent peptidase